MTSEPYGDIRMPETAYVWVWLPGALDPVVAGSISPTGQRFANEPVIAFVYARSYRERSDAISLFTPELPLRAGTFDPTRSDGSGTDHWRGTPTSSSPR